MADMTQSPTSVGRAVAAAVMSVFVGVLVWGVAVSVGVAADIVGLVFYTEEQYPHAEVWLASSVVLGAAATGTTLWRALR